MGLIVIGLHAGIGRVGVPVGIRDVRCRGHLRARDQACRWAAWGMLFMALIGLLVAMVINLFLRSDAASFVISIIGVVIFTGLTAWDVQRIQNGELRDLHRVRREGRRHGRAHLYLDFINLFLFMLRLFGGGATDRPG